MQEDLTGQTPSPSSAPSGEQTPPSIPQPAGTTPTAPASQPSAKPRRTFFQLSMGRPFIIIAISVSIIGLLALVGGVSYYIGHQVGYSKGQNAPYNNPEVSCQDAFCPAVKPVIYLYPKQAEKVSVSLDYPAGFSLTRPLYDAQTGWQVLAKPDGSLTDLSDNKTYPYLFWEGKPAAINYDMNDGFVVAGNQTVSFLRQKLSYMGLTSSETSDFITYWQGTLKRNPYNLIHFAGSEYTNYARLHVTPAPDSELRIFMVYEPLDHSRAVTPQTLHTFSRQGFAVVEWGGTRVNPTD
jgi:hypothetical protein